MDSFPIELLRHILSFSGWKRRARYELVSKKMRELIWTVPIELVGLPPAADRGLPVPDLFDFLQLATTKPGLKDNVKKLKFHFPVENSYQAPRTKARLPEVFLPLLSSPALTSIHLGNISCKLPDAIRLFGEAQLQLKSIWIEAADIYDLIDPASFATLKPTLRKLVVFPLIQTPLIRFETPVTQRLLQAIGDSVGPHLRVLGCATDDWSCLKSKLPLLRHLFVLTYSGVHVTDPYSLDTSVQKQREWNPPSVGLNIATSSGNGDFLSLLHKAIRWKIDSVPEILRLEGVDVHAKYQAFKSGDFQQPQTSLLSTMRYISIGSQRKLLDMLPDLLWVDEKRGLSIFAFHMTHLAIIDGWNDHSNWLFGNRWRKAIVKHSAEELLNERVDPLAIQLASSAEFGVISRYLMRRPEIFGENPLGRRSKRTGGNVLHYLTEPKWIAFMWDYKDVVCWKDLNFRGETALDLHARKGNEAAMNTFLLLIAKDKEIASIAQNLKYWGFLAIMEPDYRTLTTAKVQKQFQTIVEAVATQCTREVTHQILSHVIHTRIRKFSFAEALMLLKFGGPFEWVKTMTEEALLDSYDAQRWLRWFSHPTDTFFLYPLAYIVCHKDEGVEILAAIKRRMKKRHFKKFLETKAHNGSTALDYLFKGKHGYPGASMQKKFRDVIDGE